MEKYYAVKPDFKFPEYESMQKAEDSGDWMFIIVYDSIPENIKDRFKFISPADDEISFKLNYKNWSAYFDSLDTHAYFKYIDPNGQIRNEKVGYWRGISTVVDALKQLVSYSAFNDFEKYYFHIEIQNLKYEIEELKAENKDLKTQLAALQKGKEEKLC